MRPGGRADGRAGRRAAALTLLAASMLGAPPALAQGREPVLRQVQVPHPYYWREMYVPQVTSGPASVSWSPDGTELIYAMQGSLWRQRLGSQEAAEVTAGPGYDHQPDWHPDGPHVVYASYRHDAIELRLLDVTTLRDTVLLRDGAVHVDPRWSPDGTRLAWVATSHAGRWHVFVAPFANGRLGPAERITDDRDSGLPRYYYSAWDHYLSPTWSPDGTELILVSNRDRIWGTGGFWRMPARAGGVMRPLWYEETTWKARPDWSPDGHRVVYSGYHGRQWNQLWLMTAEGGDPFQLTYGEFDATAPRWSPDGTRIAYISNEGGNTSLQVVDIPGGRRTAIVATERRYRVPTGTLTISVTDARGTPIPVRLSVADAAGRGYAPDTVLRHADEAFVRGTSSFEATYFHARGTVRVPVRAGRVTLEVWRGPEWETVRETVDVAAGREITRRIVLSRIDDLPARGWWGGDLHVHMNYGGHYRNTPARLRAQAHAEGLHVVENLIVNKEQRVPDIAYFQPGPDPVSEDRFLLLHAQEYHTSFWGHTALLGLGEYYVQPDYAGYANTAAASLVPTNAQVADLARTQGGITGYVHPFDTPPDPADRTTPLSHALPIDVALGKADYLEVMGYSDHHATAEVWYRLLNAGFRVPAGAGTDAFPNYASLRGPPGLVRVYANAGARLSAATFHEAIRSGRTFVTNGPLLEFTVNGVGPGSEIRLARSDSLTVTVSLRSNLPVDRLEVVRNGTVVAVVPLDANGRVAERRLRLPAAESGWYVLRAWSERPRAPILDLYPYATTSPVYVEVAGAPIRSSEDAAFFLRWIARTEERVRAHTDWNTAAERAAVEDEIRRARAVWDERR